LFLAVTIIDDRGKLQGKSFAKQAVLCFTIVCIVNRSLAATLGIEVHGKEEKRYAIDPVFTQENMCVCVPPGKFRWARPDFIPTA
jgi:hypothetical protein